jgi:hypothetical protein
MPKHDVPNISVNALPWGLDFAVNAELHTSQQVMRDRIASHLNNAQGHLETPENPVL